MVKVLLDTDIGIDPDDALALTYLLFHPECELMGITTAGGEPVERAKLASVLCKAAGQPNIPIFPGSGIPMIVPQRQLLAPQARVLPEWQHETDYPHGAAVEFMRSTIRDNPGEVVLLEIAPTTNVGTLFATDPEVAGMLRSLYVMGGKFAGYAREPKRKTVTAFRPNRDDLLTRNGSLEVNAFLDPHATSIMHSHPAPVHRVVGCDITHTVTMTGAEFREKYTHPIFEPVLAMAEVWWEDWGEEVVFHDPLVAAAVFNDSILKYRKGQIEVELTSPELQGYTSWWPDDGGPHEVATDVDIDGFFIEFDSVFAGGRSVRS